MSVTLFDQPPPTVPNEPGPYRRADHAALPDDPRCELIHGRFYVSPSPSPLHQFVVGRIWRLLDDLAEATGGLALPAPSDVHLSDHTVAQPDVLYVSPEQRRIVQAWIEGAPDLVVEVLSPSTARADRLLKLNLYAEAGVREYWLVDPVARTIEFLVHDGEHFVVHMQDGGTWTSPAVRGVELDIDRFWAGVERGVGSSEVED